MNSHSYIFTRTNFRIFLVGTLFIQLLLEVLSLVFEDIGVHPTLIDAGEFIEADKSSNDFDEYFSAKNPEIIFFSLGIIIYSYIFIGLLCFWNHCRFFYIIYSVIIICSMPFFVTLEDASWSLMTTGYFSGITDGALLFVMFFSPLKSEFKKLSAAQ